MNDEALGAYERSAEIYDVLYAELVDYAVNTGRLRRIVAEHNPTAVTLLEVGCGTGAYLERLAPYFEVTGLDLSPGMLAVAEQRLPGVELVEGDMAAFDLGRTFDVVACLFSSIAYIRTLESLRATIACFGRHLNPGGVAIIEPWFAPEQWHDGHVATLSASTDQLAVGRVSTSRRDGNIVTMTWAFAVARPDGEVETFVEEHVTGQFTVDEHLEAFAAAGLAVDYDPVGLMGRGLYVGWPEPEA